MKSLEQAVEDMKVTLQKKDLLLTCGYTDWLEDIYHNPTVENIATMKLSMEQASILLGRLTGKQVLRDDLFIFLRRNKIMPESHMSNGRKAHDEWIESGYFIAEKVTYQTDMGLLESDWCTRVTYDGLLFFAEEMFGLKLTLKNIVDRIQTESVFLKENKVDHDKWLKTPRTPER